MIPRRRGWTFEWIGEAVLLMPRDLPGGSGGIVYVERQRPVASATELVTALLGSMRNVEVLAVAEPETFVTREGEHAALVTVEATEDGVWTQLDFGFVFADDYYASVAGSCRVPSEAARFTKTVRELVVADEHMLGVRRRPCRYSSPIGWTGTTRGLEGVWFSPDRTACLSISPALPSGGHEPGYVDQVIDLQLGIEGLEVEERSAPRPLSTPSGLHGSEWHLRGTDGGQSIHRQVAVLEDDRYLYTVRIDAVSAQALEDNRFAFLQVVRSVERVPGFSAHAHACSAQLMSHWA